MIFTMGQQKIIKRICSIQFSSLEDLLIDNNLGVTESGISYLEILDMHDCSREDFDKDLIEFYRQFQVVASDPNMLFELSDKGLNVFKQVFKLYEHTFTDENPRSVVNLWNKLFVWEQSKNITLN